MEGKGDKKEMSEVWLNKDSLEAWDSYRKMDMKYWLSGGLIASNGDMNGEIIIQLPKPDKRFRDGKRYVDIDKIPCLMKTSYTYGFPSLINEREYTKIVIIK